jgi:hypothetical protein
MRNLNYELKCLGERNRDGSHATRAKRARILSLIANPLYDLGYKKLHATELKGRHVNALVTEWQRQDLAPGTVKNRMAALRWWAEKVGRAWVLARDNVHYSIPDRQYVTNVSKAQRLSPVDLSRIGDSYVRMSLELQQTFRLRREEALKLRPRDTDRGDRLILKASWTKGARPVRSPSTPRHGARFSTAHTSWRGGGRSFLPTAPISNT